MENNAQGQDTQQGTQQPNNQQASPQGMPQNQNGQSMPGIDYDKLAQIIEGRTKAAEESAMKGYFKQQGLTQEEVEKAINSFKEEKAKNTPDLATLQSGLTAAQEEAKRAKLEQFATMQAVSLGLDAKTIPYVLKMADFTALDGKELKEEDVKKALNKVLEDIPQLKASNTKATGFQAVGANGGSKNGNESEALKKAFGLS